MRSGQRTVVGDLFLFDGLHPRQAQRGDRRLQDRQTLTESTALCRQVAP
jgi:hypothetical protein